MQNNASPVLKVSLKLKDENRRKNSLTSLEPRSERSSPCCIVSPLTDLAISVFREMRKTLCLPKSSRLLDVGSKDTS